MNLGLEGAACIVTGGSRGIGAAVGHALAAEGANVALVARDRTALTHVTDRIIADYGVRAFAVSADLSTADGAETGMASAIDRLGGVQVLVNGAGASPFGSFDRVGDEQWAASFDLKVMGYVRCTRSVLPTMRAQRSGRVVNIVGMAGRFASPGYVLGALNAALLHLTKSLADLLAPDGITVVSVNPGLTETTRMMDAMSVWADDEGADPAAYREAYAASHIPIGRFASPSEVARLVAVMASQTAGYITGSAIQVDGGAARGVF